MEAIPRKLSHYLTADNRDPYADWMETKRGQKIHAIIIQRLDRVKLGLFGDAHSVGGGVSELVIDFGPGYRVYYGLDGVGVILLLAGDKGTQGRDIKKAQEYWEDYNSA